MLKKMMAPRRLCWKVYHPLTKSRLLLEKLFLSILSSRIKRTQRFGGWQYKAKF